MGRALISAQREAMAVILHECGLQNFLRGVAIVCDARATALKPFDASKDVASYWRRVAQTMDAIAESEVVRRLSNE